MFGLDFFFFSSVRFMLIETEKTAALFKTKNKGGNSKMWTRKSHKASGNKKITRICSVFWTIDDDQLIVVPSKFLPYCLSNSVFRSIQKYPQTLTTNSIQQGVLPTTYYNTHTRSSPSTSETEAVSKMPNLQ